jgi:predicted HTH transcriptional regulator
VKAEPVSSLNSVETNSIPVTVPNKNKVLELLNKAKLAIQSRKRKKLDKVMTLFLKNSKITNDEVEKFLHVSDATAERYLNILEKKNKIKQVGKTGHAVSYTKI